MATSSDDRFRRKLAAFLADPIGAPFLSTRTDAEEEVRKRYDLGSFASDRFDAAGHMTSGLGGIVGASPDTPAPSPEETAGESVQIRHPFSGAEIEVPRPDPSALRTAIADALDRIGDLSDDPQVAYQSLWRNLRPALRAASPQAVQPVWDLAPTSFAGPSSPLFLHRSIRSALSSTRREGDGIASDASLVLFSIGPVQTFIQQARKTKDLYHGSALLSHLAWTAIRPVAEEHGPDAFVFPNLHAQPLADGWLESEGHSVLRSRSDQQRLPTLPNRFFAIVDTGDPAAIRALMRRSQEAVADEWERIGRGMFETSALASVDAPPALTDHLSDALSTYWAAVALQPGSEPVTANGTLRRLTGRIQDEQLAPLRRAVEAISDAPAAARIGLLYPLLYTLLEKQLGSTKTLRPFRQLRGGEGERGRKCSLCGERNALVYRGSPALIRHNEQAAEAPGADPVHLPEGEGLCGACLVKRFADRTGGVSLTTAFDSTADVALSAVRNRYPQAVRTCASKMKGVVPGSRFGAQLLFRENLRAGYLDAEVYPDLDRPTAELEEEADRLREAFDTYLAGPPEALQSSYYAAIALDGDSIGDWLAGANLPSLSSLLDSADGTGEALANALSRRPLTASLHGLLSESLSGYALDAVQPIVDDYNGFLVYAGGDDVLCFVGIQHVLDVLVHLRAAFSGHRSGDGTVDFTADPVGFVDEERVRTTLGPTATASAGVAIAHYKTPLRLVLDTAHRMEREHAKQHPGKDACAIALLKRSGDHAEATIPFRSAGIDHPHGLLGVIRDLVQELKATGVSARFFRAFREGIDPLTRSVGTASESEGIETPVLSRLVETEFRRLVRRRPDATDAQADRIAADLAACLKRSAPISRRSTPSSTPSYFSSKKRHPPMHLSIRPLDPVFFRDGKAFTMGEESLAEGLFPPPPSVLRGALRTRYFTEHPARLREAATETDPTASATITRLALRRGPFTLFPLPRDLVRIQGERRERVRRSRAAEPAEGVLDSSPLPAPLTHPATVQNLADAYLSDDAMDRYLSGTDADTPFTPVEEDELVTREPKIGIKQSRATRAAEDGHLYRIGFRRLADNVSFAVAVDGLSLEETGLLKLGARDRTAAYETLDRGWPQPEAPVEKIRETGHLKLYLSTPALFEGGWRPSWLDPDSLHADIGGCRLRLVGAATAKPEPIGGWNMKQNRPRPMRKAVPAGGVYVFSVASGDPTAAAEAWHGESVSDYRRADGFGLALVGVARPPLPEPSEADL